MRDARVALIMKTSISVKLNTKLLRQVKAIAAERNISVDAILTARLEEMVRSRKLYKRARRPGLARLRDGMQLQWSPAGSREELHERRSKP
jgi:hypothetical protein